MNARVKDVMTKNVVCVQPDATFQAVVGVLIAHRVSAVPVVDDANHVVGIVSEADLMLRAEHPSRKRAEYWQAWLKTSHDEAALRFARELEKAMARTAGEMMTSEVVTIAPEATVGEAAGLMHKKHVKRLPVVDLTGKLVGIVSRGDVLKVFAPSPVPV